MPPSHPPRLVSVNHAPPPTCLAGHVRIYSRHASRFHPLPSDIALQPLPHSTALALRYTPTQTSTRMGMLGYWRDSGRAR